MTEKQEILQLLEEKQQLMHKIEELSDAIYALPIEELQDRIGKRQALVHKMELIDEKVDLLCSGLEKQVREAVENNCDRGTLEGENAQIYDKALAIKAIAHRVLEDADLVRERMEYEIAQTKEEIESLNTSSAVVAGRYGKAVRTYSNPTQPWNHHGIKI